MITRDVAIVLIAMCAWYGEVCCQPGTSVSDWGEKSAGLQLRARVPDSVGYGDTIVVGLEVRAWPGELPQGGVTLDRRESAYATLTLFDLRGELVRTIPAHRALVGYKPDTVRKRVEFPAALQTDQDTSGAIIGERHTSRSRLLSSVAFDPWRYEGFGTKYSYLRYYPSAKNSEGAEYTYRLRAVNGGEYTGQIELVIPFEDCSQGWSGVVKTAKFDILIGQEQYVVDTYSFEIPSRVYLSDGRIDSLDMDTYTVQFRKGFQLGFGYWGPGGAVFGVFSARDVALQTLTGLSPSDSLAKIRYSVMESSEGMGHGGLIYGWGVKTLFRQEIIINYVRSNSNDR